MSFHFGIVSIILLGLGIISIAGFIVIIALVIRKLTKKE